ncbi:MAG TPA: response regulator, partial [Dehalococcoidia bacterium]|nr:response regulator [Dehalococcoidia bacterium]
LGRLYLTEKIGAEEFSPDDEARAMALAFQAGAAIEGARLNGILASGEERLRALTGQLLQAQEDERRRLAYDIHDGLGQMIVAAGMHMDIYRAERKGKEEPRLEEEFGKAVRYLQEAIVETRRIVSELRPALLDDFGLVEALRHFLEEVAARAGWQAQMVENLGTTRLEPVVETALLRIAQEALANAYRHAQAERVEVRLLKEGQQVLLEVEDWGRGFDSARAAASDGSDRHFGLDSMQERAKLLGADFQCRSAPGQGTTISVSLVLGEEEGISTREEAAVTEEERRDTAAPAAGRGITVLICDDHPMVREGLRSMLNMPGVTLVGEAATGKEAVEEVRKLGPQVVLMDVRMPDMD